MITQNFLKEIETLAHQKRWAAIKAKAEHLQPGDVAELLLRLPIGEQILFFRSLPRQLAADSFAFLDENAQQVLLGQMGDKETRHLLSDLSPDDRTELFDELPADATKRLLNLLPSEELQEALMLLGYPKGSVARLMSPDLVKITPGLTVSEALAEIKKQAHDSETINVIYVTDEKDRLIDEIKFRKLFLANPDEPVSNLLDGSFRALNAFSSEDDAIYLMQKTGLFALPVTDMEGVLLGIVTADDVLDLAVEAATDDIHKGGALKPLDMGYLRAPLKTLYSRRISWLVILVFMNIFSGAGIAYYEELIESVVALVFFLPLLIDSGGNAGSQAATLVIRSMALGEIKIRDYMKVMFRELRVSLLLGLSMSVAVFLLAWWRSGIEIALVVSLAMTCIVFLGSLIGMSLPFILRKLNQDPAAASAPLVTSIADISGVLIYLGIASALLGSMIE